MSDTKNEDEFGITFVINQIREDQRDIIQDVKEIKETVAKHDVQLATIERLHHIQREESASDREQFKAARNQVIVHFIWGTILALVTFGITIWNKLSGGGL
jgi:hypothetical protein